MFLGVGHRFEPEWAGDPVTQDPGKDDGDSYEISYELDSWDSLDDLEVRAVESPPVPSKLLRKFRLHLVRGHWQILDVE